MSDLDDLFLEIVEEPEPEPEPELIDIREILLKGKIGDILVAPAPPVPDEEKQEAMAQAQELAKVELTKEEKLEKAAELLGVSATDFNGEDDEFLTHVALEYKVILALHMTGRSPTYIARAVESTPYRISKVLSSPQNLNIINHWKRAIEVELDGLLPLAIDAVRKGLLSGDRKVNLMAVDRYVKLRGDEADKTGVTVQIVQDARGSFLENLKGIAEAKGILDGKFKEVSNAPTE